jgi:hypothetical protein
MTLKSANVTQSTAAGVVTPTTPKRSPSFTDIPDSPITVEYESRMSPKRSLYDSPILEDVRFVNFDDDDKKEGDHDFLSRLYEEVVDKSCNAMMCAARIEEQLDMLTVSMHA